MLNTNAEIREARDEVRAILRDGFKTDIYNGVFVHTDAVRRIEKIVYKLARKCEDLHDDLMRLRRNTGDEGPPEEPCTPCSI